MVRRRSHLIWLSVTVSWFPERLWKQQEEEKYCIGIKTNIVTLYEESYPILERKLTASCAKCLQVKRSLMRSKWQKSNHLLLINNALLMSLNVTYLIYEMLFIRNKKTKLNTLSDSIKQNYLPDNLKQPLLFNHMQLNFHTICYYKRNPIINILLGLENDGME